MKRSSLLGVATALALVAGQAGTALHLAVVAHHRCVLHGELIEAPRPTGAATAAAPRELPEQPAVDAAGEHHHDHCTLALLARGCTPGAGGRADAPGCDDSASPVVPRTPAPAACVLQVAPKTSPPSAATSA